MKKTYLHKIAMPILLAMLLAGGVGNAWGMEGEEAQLAEEARVMRLAEEERAAAAAKAAESARTAHKEAAAKLETAQKQKETATETLVSAKAELEKLNKKTSQSPEEQRRVKELQTQIAGHEEIIKGHEAAATEQEKTIAKQKAEEAAQKKVHEDTQKRIAALKEIEAKPLEEEGTSKITPVKEKTTAKTGKPGEEAKPSIEGEKAAAEKKTLKETVTDKLKWIVDHPGKAGMGGVVILGGLIATIFAVVGEVSKGAADLKKQIEDDWGLNKGDNPDGDNTTNNPPLPKADPDNPDYAKTLGDVVALFTNFDQDLKKMLEENADYTAKSVQFEAGTVEIDGNEVAVSIRWDMEQNDLGLPLIPVIITLSPEDLRGFALTPADILGKMDEGPAKDALTLVLNPTASLIFTVKLIQLYNTASKEYPNDDFARIEYMLDEATKLYSRFVLSKNEDVTPDALNSYLQQYQTIVEVLNDKNVKVYKALTDDSDTALDQQKTAFMDMQQSEMMEGPLLDAIKIFYNNFYQIYYKKFKNDGKYVESPLTPGTRATKNMLQAIFYRGLQDTVRAAQELQNADGQVTLRRLDGTSYTVSPKIDLNALIEKPSSAIEAASGSLKDAILGIKKIIDAAKAAKEVVVSKDMGSAKDAYEKAISGVKTASGAAADALLKFRKTFAPFYPLTWDDGTSLTPAEFLVANIKDLNAADPSNVKNLISKVYAPFSKELGLSVENLLGNTQVTGVDKAVGTVIGKVKSLVKGSTGSTTPPVKTVTAGAATAD